MKNKNMNENGNRNVNNGGRKWLAEEEAARYLGLNKYTLQRWRLKKGVVHSNGTVTPGPKYYKPAGRVLYDQQDLDNWVITEGA